MTKEQLLLKLDKKDLHHEIVKMYKVQGEEAETLYEMLVKLDKREVKMLCKLVRVANKVICD